MIIQVNTDSNVEGSLEARLAGIQPLVASHQAATMEQAVDGAVDKLMRSIDTTLGKLENQ